MEYGPVRLRVARHQTALPGWGVANVASNQPRTASVGLTTLGSPTLVYGFPRRSTIQPRPPSQGREGWRQTVALDMHAAREATNCDFLGK